jgi:hypothetical protein
VLPEEEPDDEADEGDEFDQGDGVLSHSGHLVMCRMDPVEGVNEAGPRKREHSVIARILDASANIVRPHASQFVSFILTYVLDEIQRAWFAVKPRPRSSQNPLVTRVR